MDIVKFSFFAVILLSFGFAWAQDTQELEHIQKLRLISYEQGMGRVMTDFHQNWDDSAVKFIIPASELEARFRAVAGDRKGPIMVISEPGRVRVMALGSEMAPAQ